MMGLAWGLLSAAFVVVGFGALAWSHHVFQCAGILNADTRAMFKRMADAGAFSPRHEIPPPAPSPPVEVEVDVTPVHNEHGPCEACGSQWCREVKTKPAPTSTKGLPGLPGSEEGPPSRASKTLVGLAPGKAHLVGINCPPPEG